MPNGVRTRCSISGVSGIVPSKLPGWTMSPVGARGREFPVFGRKSIGLRASPQVDPLLIAHHFKRPLQAVVGVGEQSRAKQYRERRTGSKQRLARPQAVGLFVNLNGRDVVIERDYLAGQTCFAHLNLFEHAERTGDPRPDNGAADPGQRADRVKTRLKVLPCDKIWNTCSRSVSCARANWVGNVASKRHAPAGSQQPSPCGGGLRRAMEPDCRLPWTIAPEFPADSSS